MKYLIVWGGLGVLLAVLWVFYRSKPGRRLPSNPTRRRVLQTSETPAEISARTAATLRSQITDFLQPDGVLPAGAKDNFSIGYVVGWVLATFLAYGHEWKSATTEAAKAAVFRDLYGEPEGKALLARYLLMVAAEDDAIFIGEHLGSVDASASLKNRLHDPKWREYLQGGIKI